MLLMNENKIHDMLVSIIWYKMKRNSFYLPQVSEYSSLQLVDLKQSQLESNFREESIKSNCIYLQIRNKAFDMIVKPNMNRYIQRETATKLVL